MKPGIVVSIRVNPRDCMTIADLAAKEQLAVQGMSFSSAVSIVLSALCQAAREMGVAPERDGFEFSEMMKLFTHPERKRAYSITSAVTNAGSEFRVKAVSMPLAPSIQKFNKGVAGPAGPTPTMRRAEVHMRELLAKKEAALDSWTAKDEQELERYIAIAAGDVAPEQQQE